MNGISPSKTIGVASAGTPADAAARWHDPQPTLARRPTRHQAVGLAKLEMDMELNRLRGIDKWQW